jgi:hypothetical protein
VLLLASFAGLAACSPGEPRPAPAAAMAAPAATRDEEPPVQVAAIEAAPVDYRQAAEETRVRSLEAVKKLTLLDPDQFPEAPPELRQALQALGCRIPQSLFTYFGGYDSERRAQDGLIPGHFKSSSEIHWAALCTRSEKTSLLLFDSLGQNMEILVEPLDNTYVLDSTHLNDQLDFSWYSGVVEEDVLAAEFAEYKEEIPTPPLLAVEALASGSNERSVTYFYWHECKWIKLETDC